MSKTEDVSVLGRLYHNQSLRFGLFPDSRSDFQASPHLVDAPYDILDIRLTEESVQYCQRGNLRFLYDPTLNLFKLSIKKKELLNGALQTGQFGSALFFIELKKNERVYGFGSVSKQTTRNGLEFQFLNQDSFGYRFEQSSHTSFPFFLLRRSHECVGILWNSTLPAQVRTVNESKESLKRGIYITPLDNQKPIAQDFFVFTGTVPQIFSQFFGVCGQAFLPPLWALGYHQSHKSYRSEAEVLKASKNLRHEGIPCDAIHLNRHYIEYPFSWHPDRFPDPMRLHEKINAMGFHSVTSVHLEVPLSTLKKLENSINPSSSSKALLTAKVKGYYCKTVKNNKLYIGNTSLGKVVFPDFTASTVQEWWRDLHHSLLEVGVSGINIDSVFSSARAKKNYRLLFENIEHQKGKHTEVHNFYANLAAQISYTAYAQYTKRLRPWLSTRSAFCGIHKYAAVSLGNTYNSWKHQWKALEESLHTILNVSLSGVPYCGSTIVGSGTSHPLSGFFDFFKTAKNSELFCRWIELMSLMPIFHVHSSLLSPSNRWLWRLDFGSKALSICRKHILRRYRLLPYLYTLAWEIHSKGGLWVRPLFYEFPEMPPVFEQDQFFIGSALLVAPIIHSQQKTRRVYLPPGAWYEYESGTLYQGSTTHHFKVYSGSYPLFVKAGTILPVCYPSQNAKRSLTDTLILEVYPSDLLHGSFYIDDGSTTDYKNNMYTQLKFEGRMNSTHTLIIQIKAIKQHYSLSLRYIEFRLPTQYFYLQNRRGTEKPKLLDMSSEGRKFQVHSFRVPFAIGRYMFKTQEATS